MNADGTPGIIKTPGSTIKAQLDKAIGIPQDKLVQMGQLANEVNSILGNIGTVFSTVNLASQILGGPNSGGLFGIGQTNVSSPVSPLRQYQDSSLLGVAPSTVFQNASNLPSSGSDMLTRVGEYRTAWNTLSGAANAASTTVASLINFCTTAISNASTNEESGDAGLVSRSQTQIAAAQQALTTEIAPVLAQARTAFSTIDAAVAMVQKVQTELSSGIDPNNPSYLADLQTLQTMPPTLIDVANVQQEILSFNMATAIPFGSLTVSGGTTVDRMSLISTNAEALKSECTRSSRTNDSSD